jgi:hypothetical protein
MRRPRETLYLWPQPDTRVAMVPDKLALGNEGLVSHDANRLSTSRRASAPLRLEDAEWRCAENAAAKVTAM